MSEQKRITPDEVVAAYKATGLRPKICTTAPDNGQCCGIGVLFMRDNPDDTSFGVTIRDEMNAIYGAEYIDGFTQGFDSRELEFADGDDPFSIGRLDGQACAIAAFRYAKAAFRDTPAR